VTYYVIAYAVTTLGAFAVLSVLAEPQREADELADLQGLGWQRPALGLLLVVCMLSLAGMPLTAGFVAKIYVVAAGVSGARWGLVLLLALGSLISLYYYLRVVVTVVARAPSGEPAAVARMPAGAAAVLAVAGVLLVWLGVYPAPLQEVIAIAVAALG
jgi:NADH-quinone oxidoreductase subunit N